MIPSDIQVFGSNVDRPWKEKVKFLIQEFAHLPQSECPTKHHFAPGVYIREIFMPAGAIVIGKIHKTTHFNIVQRGRLALFSENPMQIIEGPTTFVSEASVQKVLYIDEDTVWSTVHLTEERDLERLETSLIEPDDYPLLDRTVERLAIEDAQCRGAQSWHG